MCFAKNTDQLFEIPLILIKTDIWQNWRPSQHLDLFVMVLKWFPDISVVWLSELSFLKQKVHRQNRQVRQMFDAPQKYLEKGTPNTILICISSNNSNEPPYTPIKSLSVPLIILYQHNSTSTEESPGQQTEVW